MSTRQAESLLRAIVVSCLLLLPISLARGAVEAITDIAKTGDDVTIVWDAFGVGGPYTVQCTNDLVAGLWTDEASTTAMTWTDSGVLSTQAIRFYRVESGGSGGSHTYPVGFVKVDTVRDEVTMISVPLLWDPPADPLDKKLNGPIGWMIGENLTGGTGGTTGDMIWNWIPVLQSYGETAFLIEGWPEHDGEWYDEWAGDLSAMTFDLGEGFWVRRTHWGPEMATIIFLGWVPTANTIPLTLVRGLTMFNWPYPTTPKLNDSTLGRVGHGGASAASADVVWRWDGVAKRYTMAFLVDLPGTPFHGKWFDPAAGAVSNISFIPGTAMWYERKPVTPAVWVCTRPYSF